MNLAINPDEAPTAIGPFSQGIIAEGRFLFVSGQGPQTPDRSGFRLGDFEAEVRLTLANLTRILTSAGADWRHVVRVGVYLTDSEHFADFNRIYAEFAREPFPARTTVVCSLLAGIAVEVDCVAALPSG